jgi:transcriptional regulator with XRE-family HTH domain
MPEKDKRRVFPSRLALRDMRLRTGLTEQVLAARLGVTYHTIQAWEKGERPVRTDWLLKLATALGCSIADLRQVESIARSRGQRQALGKLRNTPSSAPPDARGRRRLGIRSVPFTRSNLFNGLRDGRDFILTSGLSLAQLKQRLRAALAARAWFDKQGPAWATPLPLREEECAALQRDASNRLKLVGYYGSSLRRLDFDYLAHPLLYDYCRGVMAHPNPPTGLRDDPD